MTSVALIKAYTGVPTFKPSARAASLVMIDVISFPSDINDGLIRLLEGIIYLTNSKCAGSKPRMFNTLPNTLPRPLLFLKRAAQVLVVTYLGRA
jgi:hypothetical protein